MKKILGIVAGMGLLLSSGAFASPMNPYAVSAAMFDGWDITDADPAAGGGFWGNDPTNSQNVFNVNFNANGGLGWATLGADYSQINLTSYDGMRLQVTNSSMQDLTTNLYVIAAGTTYYALTGTANDGVLLADGDNYSFDWEWTGFDISAITEIGLYLEVPDDTDGIHGKIPEPATLALMGLGLLGFGLRRKPKA